MKLLIITQWVAIAAIAVGSIALAQVATPQVVLPCKIVSVYDGDTPTVTVTFRMSIRLLDCWCPEIKGANREAGLKAKKKLEELALDKNGLVTIPLGKSLGDSLTLDRILAKVTVDGTDVGGELVRLGYATKTKKAADVRSRSAKDKLKKAMNTKGL